MNRRQVSRYCRHRIPLFPEAVKLRVVPVSPGLTKKNSLRQEPFPPESKQTLTIQILRV